MFDLGELRGCCCCGCVTGGTLASTGGNGG